MPRPPRRGRRRCGARSSRRLRRSPPMSARACSRSTRSTCSIRLRALRRGLSVAVAGGARLAVVAAAAQHPAALAGEELLEVLARDVLELEPQLGGELAGIPEDVAELPRQRQPAPVADLAAVIAD